MKKISLFLALLISLLVLLDSCVGDSRYKALIITGQNNHNWQESSPILKRILEQTGLFTADIIKTPDKGGDMTAFNPDFSAYKLVVLDYNGDPWSAKTDSSFVHFVKNGGGVVVYHAADNSFPGWKEYNLMTGLGGWGDRSKKDGPYVYYKNNKLVQDTSAGTGGSHGKRREYLVRVRIQDHPITHGLPVMWMHATDELYSQLRGPAKNMQILATAFADSAAGGGTMRDEPMLMTITFGKGRIFHTVMGHADVNGGPAMHCAGFIVTLQRGAEWAVTGNVTQKVPWDFPNAAGVVLRPDFRELNLDEAFSSIGSYELNKSTKSLSCIQAAIRASDGDPAHLLDIEKKMVVVLKDANASAEGKKLLLRELSWMGSSYSIGVIKDLSTNTDLKDEAQYALSRLQK